MSLITMYDGIDPALIPADATAAAGYVGGKWPTFRDLAARFPHALRLSIAVNASEDAECLDVETGDASPADIPAWVARQRARGVARPCIYANAFTMESGVLPVLASAKIGRASVRLWSAHYAGTHICGPSSCKAVSIEMDGTQWTQDALGRNLDQSLLAADFFGAAAQPAAPAKPATPPAVRQWVTRGQGSLAALATAQHTEPSTILRLTAEHSPGSIYPPNVAAWINDVFAGTGHPADLIPAGLVLYLPA